MKKQNHDLFDQRRELLAKKHAPLADRMRPRTLDEFIGQQHIIGPGRLLRRAIQIDQLSSVIFYGPPGTGKTTLARIIANTTKAQFLSINAVLAGVKDIRESIAQAQQMLALHGKRTILFVDEVHRFNKAQQDALLPHVENGTIILIGATTENPYFEVNKALVSRSRIFQLRPLTKEDLKDVAYQALEDTQRGFGERKVSIDHDALEHLVTTANGDARGVLNSLELAVETTPSNNQGTIHITRSVAEESIQHKAVLYDKDGDAHYDTISAFIKSIRGSDPDASLYWMARMVYAGEDPRFIFRRMLILACEDVGLADPHALTVVLNAAQAFDYVGLPEGRFHLAQACLYLATAPKSNSSLAFFDALEAVEKESVSDDIPDHLRDASRDGDDLGHGKDYLYPHAFRDHWVAQQYLPELLQGRVFYQPSDQGFEKEIAERTVRHRELMVEAMAEDMDSDPFKIEQKGAGKWAHRTESQQVLSAIREKTFQFARIDRESVVLDLNAHTGLLCMEAVRKVREGAVWAIARTPQSFEALNATTKALDELSKPVVLHSEWDATAQTLSASGASPEMFTAMVGRSVCARNDFPRSNLEKILPFLAPDGIIALAEQLPAQSTRPSEMVPLPPEQKAVLDKAEVTLFDAVRVDGMTLSDDTLERTFDIPGYETRVVTSEISHSRKFSIGQIDFWFRTDSPDESLGQVLWRLGGNEAAEEIHTALRVHLAGKEIPWTTRVAYVLIRKS